MEKVEIDSEDKEEGIGALTKQGWDHAASKGNGGGMKGRGASAGKDQDG